MKRPTKEDLIFYPLFTLLLFAFVAFALIVPELLYNLIFGG